MSRFPMKKAKPLPPVVNNTVLWPNPETGPYVISKKLKELIDNELSTLQYKKQGLNN